MSDIRSLVPAGEADFARVAEFVDRLRLAWEHDLEVGLRELVGQLADGGYTPITDEHPDLVTEAPGSDDARVAWVSWRLKDTAAIVAKMRRFGEPLRVILDVWGYRVVVDDPQLDDAARCCAELWETPTPGELLLRHGELPFDWWRDYRQRSHAGLSPATTAGYDQAIHLNRRAPFGIVEIQVMARSLHQRVHGDPASEDSHDRFVDRRQALFRPDRP